MGRSDDLGDGNRQSDRGIDEHSRYSQCHPQARESEGRTPLPIARPLFEAIASPPISHSTRSAGASGFARPEVRETVWVAASDSRPEPTRWIIHGERLVDDTRRLRLSIAHVELPDGVHFEQYVLRMPKAVMTVLLDDAAQRVLMIWRHRFVPDSWTWELPGGYLDPGEDPVVTAVREVTEETGWRPQHMRLLTRFQPLTGSADFENLIFLGEGAEDTGEPADINEAARTEWITLDSIPDRIARNEIIGAGTQIGLLHVLAFHRRGHVH